MLRTVEEAGTAVVGKLLEQVQGESTDQSVSEHTSQNGKRTCWEGKMERTKRILGERLRVFFVEGGSRYTFLFPGHSL
jgi:hypothetical protein